MAALGNPSTFSEKHAGEADNHQPQKFEQSHRPAIAAPLPGREAVSPRDNHSPDRHNQRIYRAARAILKEDGEAEDVMQDTYVRAYLESAIGQLPEGRSSCSAR